MTITKIFFFFLIVLGAGLLQLWVAATTLFYKNVPFNLEMLMKNGSVFFFSTSLAFNNLFILFEKGSRTTAERLVSLLLVGPVTILALCAYALEYSAASTVQAPLNFTGNYFAAQLSCAICAITYATYVSAVTGMFRRENKKYGQY